MSITLLTDDEILAIAIPMIDAVVKASNGKDWDAFCVYQTKEEAEDPENKAGVIKAWEEFDLFSSLTLERQILGVLRNEDIAQIVWKQTSTKVEGEYLARYFITEIDKEIKEVGFVIN
ncbi:hypothetical protein G5S52_06380 [Grimontia sp. S25]|uniref:Nuclear transport factor 2 family protein n=1 Tax=Grimontia sedimenti TaxID=2711294 RepID=A0A6M1RIC3_9GAMM|nr:hypothetical protein [Grimontia sedimenti]NGN97299.1 hypothetical protein [Grimontia sedimenti]